MIAESTEMKVSSIPLNHIFNDEDFNCRGRIAPIDVIDLANSIKAHGLQQPIVVQPWSNPEMPSVRYRCISGHRRYVAHIVNGSDTISAIIKEGLSDLDAVRMNLEENLMRKDLNILQEARAINKFKLHFWKEEDVASEIGKSRGWVQVRFMLLDLPEEIQQEAAAGFLNQAQIRELHGMRKELQFEAVKKLKVARLNNESTSKIRLKEKKVKPFEKKERDRAEIFKIQTHIQELVGNNFGTRCLAWAAGEISTYDLLNNDLREIADEHGIKYTLPPEIQEKVW